MCKHGRLLVRMKEEENIIVRQLNRQLPLEVARDVALVVRKREASKPRSDPSRNEIILSTIPNSGDISPQKLLQLLAAQPSHPPSGMVNQYTAAAAESTPTDDPMSEGEDESEGEGEGDSESRGAGTGPSHSRSYTNPSLQPGMIIEYWWPDASYIGMVIRPLPAGDPFDQIIGLKRKQVSLLHRASAYEVMFEDESETKGLCLPAELRYEGNGTSSSKSRSLNDWALLSRLPKGHPKLATQAQQMGLSTVTQTIAPLIFRAESAVTTFAFSKTTPLGITFALNASQHVCVHSFCHLSPGVPGPAPYSVSHGPQRVIRALDVVLQVTQTRLTCAHTQVYTHARTQVDSTVLSDLSPEQRVSRVKDLVGPVELRVAPCLAAQPPLVNLIQKEAEPVVRVPLATPQLQTAQDRAVRSIPVVTQRWVARLTCNTK